MTKTVTVLTRALGERREKSDPGEKAGVTSWQMRAKSSGSQSLVPRPATAASPPGNLLEM